MMSIEKDYYPQLYEQYLRQNSIFPLIASVLCNEQDGVVYVDDLVAPSQVYVEHIFGFAQIFGQVSRHFEESLAHYFLKDKSFFAPKIRLYTPHLPEFLISCKHDVLRSFRQRFIFSPERVNNQTISYRKDLEVMCINTSNMMKIVSQFDFITRFWRNVMDFALKSQAIVVSYRKAPASICYAAARADDFLEIDVFTLPQYRHLGLAKCAVEHFIKRAFHLSLHPLWDCYINNEASMALCKSVGFVALSEPYPFYTINK